MKWIALKERLHSTNHRPPFVSKRDLWWISFGENIGSEINGKNKHFTRPGLVLKKLAHGFYLVAPTTTKHHEGSWYVAVRLGKVREYVCLHQIRVVDYRRIYSKLGQIDTHDFAEVCERFRCLYI